MNNLRNTSELLDRAEITLTNAMASFDMDKEAFKISNEDLVITLRLAIELIIEAQNEVSGCERKTSLIQFF
ncbi:MAG: hypothetical protein ACJA2G_002753 [Cognaticolwellia sp.]|jgi:hypothetical protein